MQQQKMHMSKKQFRIGDLAKELKVKKFVVRFWEKEFGIKSDRSGGGQRFYTTQDLKLFLLIKDLLYNQGFTIAGAKKQLEVADVSSSVACQDHLVGHATQDLNTGDDLELDESLLVSSQDVEHQPAETCNQDEMVTPATRASCTCGSVAAKLGLLKEQLAQLKALLEQSRIS